MARLVGNNRYQLIQHLGGGGFGETYLAKDLHLPGHTLCVVKQFKGQIHDPSIVKIFTKEAEVLNRLGQQHECIPRLLEWFSQGDWFYLVQEYVEGVNLGEFIPPKYIWDEKQVMMLLEQIINILVFVHQQKEIHCDIKPENLILRKRDKKYVLIDFGAVKRLNTSNNKSTICFTEGYVAPEHRQGNPQFRSDIYSLGIVGIQFLTGLNPSSIPINSKTGEFAWREQVKISSAFANILDSMVRQNYQERPDAQQVLALLKNLIKTPQTQKTELLSRSFSKKSSVKASSLMYIIPILTISIVSIIRYEDLPLNEPPQPPSNSATPSVPSTSPTIEPLPSDVKVDYSLLRDFLAAKDWKSAEQETTKVMLQAFGLSNGKLRAEQVDRFPCKDLQTINSLWTRYSDGYFGISTQKSIWQGLRGSRNVWKETASKIGWLTQSGSLIPGKDVTYDLTSPRGHLPFLEILSTEKLLLRAEKCGL